MTIHHDVHFESSASDDQFWSLGCEVPWPTDNRSRHGVPERGLHFSTRKGRSQAQFITYRVPQTIRSIPRRNIGIKSRSYLVTYTLIRVSPRRTVDMAKPPPNLPRRRDDESDIDRGPPIGLASVAIAGWLVIAGVAFSSECQNSESAQIIVLLSMLVQFFVFVALKVFIDFGWPNRGTQLFAAGMVGFGLASFYVLSLSSLSGIRAWLCSISGIYAGWIFEMVVGAMARLEEYLAAMLPAKQPTTATRGQESR